MRILAVDYGLKRIGIAIADTNINIAFARDAIESNGSQEDASAIAALYKDEECSLALVGLPLLESGEEGEQARITLEFSEQLKQHNVNVMMWDERFTTGAANRNLSHLDPKSRKKLLDSEAARVMLAEYLASLDS